IKIKAKTSTLNIMEKHSFALSNKISVSLSSILESSKQNQKPIAAARATGFLSNIETPTLPQDLVAVTIKVNNNSAFESSKPTLNSEETLNLIGGEYYSGKLSVSNLQQLVDNPNVERIETKKTYTPSLEQASTEIGVLRNADGSRPIAETGKDVLIGIVDSGFDLSHPMFRDSSGNLRVVALLDQTVVGNPEYDTATLETEWRVGGSRPGRDTNGHGTHVATIAGGSKFGQCEGIAPEAQFLLVKTNLRDVDDAVSWIYQKAGSNPCVANLSLGGHFGSHDGTSNAELLYDTLVGSGKILVASAGNERNDSLHLNGLFVPNQIEEVTFDILPQVPPDTPFAATTFWYPDVDDYEVELITPSGQALPTPTLNNTDSYNGGSLEIEISRLAYPQNDLTQIQIAISFTTSSVPPSSLQDWRFRIRCVAATVGRFDAWFLNSGFARFEPHPLVKAEGTIGIPATSNGCIAVASHVSKNTWDSDDGLQQDLRALVGRSSNFSSLGPTRDGRWKPEISAPGQYLTAGLADGSFLSTITERAKNTERLLSIEGTSMAAPVVTGAIALMLEKNPSLTPTQIKEILKETAKKDNHTQVTPWTAAYGYGKLDIVAALSKI
ncbi:MAG: S8 family peptidase, partial [Cyanobacteria bacterium P01_F01_bin.143]